MTPAEERQRQFHDLTHTVFDALVIGGGITGAGIAWQLSRWGLKTALVEQQDFAAGTSSRSSKLIHGGFRYLPHGEIRLVRQVAAERTRLARLMPHLIRPLSMTVPAYRGQGYPLPLLSMGAWVYDRLGHIDRDHIPVKLDPVGVTRKVPGISQDRLTGGVAYYEFSGHDARITWAVLGTSLTLGVHAMNYVAADLTRSILHPHGVSEVGVRDDLSGEESAVEARVVINAAGPWGDTLEPSAHLIRSRGIHLAFNAERFSLPGAVALATPNNANVFAVPRGPVTYIGTTDQQDTGDATHPPIPLSDARYLLQAANRTFPDLGLKLADVVAAWSGVRPLIAQDAGARTDQLSRRDMILPGAPLITVLGGKFTGFRATAEAVTRTVLERLGGTGKAPVSEEIADAPPKDAIPALTTRLAQSYHLAGEWADRLVERYGTAAARLLDGSDDARAPLLGNLPILAAEVDWAVLKERAVTVADVLVRRTGVAWLSGLSPTRVLEAASATADRMRDLLGWSEEERIRQLALFRKQSYLDEVQSLRDCSPT